VINVHEVLVPFTEILGPGLRIRFIITGWGRGIGLVMFLITSWGWVFGLVICTKLDDFLENFFSNLKTVSMLRACCGAGATHTRDWDSLVHLSKIFEHVRKEDRLLCNLRVLHAVSSC